MIKSIQTMQERLQKILSRAGLGSRRACESIISAGRVRVNGKTAVLGSKADPETDEVMVDGQTLSKPEPRLYIALHKPRGVLSTVEAPDPRPTVRDMIPLPGSLYPVGRLDLDSEGLILMTNDGELANYILHPRYGHEKEYRVLVARLPDDEQLAAWQHGVVLEDGTRTAPAQVNVEKLAGKGAWLRVIMKEGRKRQIREVGSRLGLPIVRIIRVRIGTLKLGNLKLGDWRYLTPAEVSALKGQPEKTGVRQEKSGLKFKKTRIKPTKTSARSVQAGTRSAHSGGRLKREGSHRPSSRRAKQPKR